MADQGTILVKLKDIIRQIAAGDSAEAISNLDSVLRDDIIPLCAEPHAERHLSKRALRLRDDLIAVRSTLVRDTGEALGVAYGALGPGPAGSSHEGARI
jgi:hypothetical protein